MRCPKCHIEISETHLTGSKAENCPNEECFLDISRGEITPVKVSDTSVSWPDRKERDIDWADTRGFWQKPLGRTLRGKNKTGKIIYGLGGLAITTVTGLNLNWLPFILNGAGTMEQLFDLSLIQFVIVIVLMAVSFGVGLLKLGPNTVSKIRVAVERLSNELVEATDEKSDGGKRITRAEIREIAVDTLGTYFKPIKKEGS